MNYPKYLHTNQEVILKVTVDGDESAPRFDTVFARVAHCDDERVELVFTEQHGNHADYPFQRRQPLEILSEYLDMGVTARATVLERRGGDRLVLEMSGELSYFNRRRSGRIDTELWIGLEENPVSIAIVRERWEQAIQQIRKKGGAPQFATFARMTISLSASGIGIDYPSAVQPGTYFLIHLALDDNDEMICIVGEVVRSEPGEENTFYLGIHFDCIEEEGRKRIDRYVRQNNRPA